MAKPKAKVAATPTHDDESMEELDILELDQNLEDYEEPELLPPGYYVGEIQEVVIKPNQKGTGRYYAVKFVIPPERYPASYDVENWPEGVPLFYNLIRVPRAGDRRAVSNLRKFVQKLGLSTSTNRIDPNEWINKQAKLKVIHNEYQGVTREQIAANGIEEAD